MSTGEGMDIGLCITETHSWTTLSICNSISWWTNELKVYKNKLSLSA